MHLRYDLEYYLEFIFIKIKLYFDLQQLDQENEQRRRLEQAAALAATKKESDQVMLRNKFNQKKQQVSGRRSGSLAAANMAVNKSFKFISFL